MPKDTKKNAGFLIEKLKPKCIIFTKYDLWYHLINEASCRKIKIVLQSALFYKNQIYFKKQVGYFFKNMLSKFDVIYCQNSNSKTVLEKNKIETEIIVNGDTRMERVLEICSQDFVNTSIDKFINTNSKILVAGSTWIEDDKILAEFLKTKNNEWKLIIAPHEINPKRIEECKSIFKNYEPELISNNTLSDTNKVLIIDNFGMLNFLYRYGTINYVGGGFNKSGIHNVLEAAVYKKPVIFGKYYKKFPEAVELTDLQTALSIHNVEDMSEAILYFTNPQKTSLVKNELTHFFKNGLHVSDELIHYFFENRLLIES